MVTKNAVFMRSVVFCKRLCNYKKDEEPFSYSLITDKQNTYMNKYYQRQFRQMVDCIRYDEATEIISEINTICQQLIRLPEHHGVDVNGFPQLSKDDFWYMEEDSTTFE